MNYIWIFVSYILIRILINGFYDAWKSRKKKESRLECIEAVFLRHNIEKPQITFGKSYSWTTCNVCFTSKEDYDYAHKNGLFESCEKRLEVFEEPGFIVEMAISFNYLGQDKLK